MKPAAYPYFLLSFIITCYLFQACGERKSNNFKQLDPQKLFVYEVYPLLEAKCFACHGNDAEDIEGDFDIRTLDGMLKGGESGHRH